MSASVFYARAGMGRPVRGQALVAKDGFSARYDLDRVRGVFSRPEHNLVGQSYVGRVLVLVFDVAVRGEHEGLGPRLRRQCLQMLRRERVQPAQPIRPADADDPGSSGTGPAR